MTNEELKNYIETWNDDAEFLQEAATENQLIGVLEDMPSPFLNIEIPLTHLKTFLKRLKEDPQLNFDTLFNMAGMDWGKELGVIYFLESSQFNHAVTVRVKTGDRENPVLPTVSDLWFAAHLHECEIYDMFGIRFEGHNGLKRLFLTPDFEGFPLRKDYEDDYMIIRK